MNLSRKIKKRAEQTMANPPTKLRLPGGVEVRKFQFRITAVDAHGRPIAFELAPTGTASDCCLWASPEFIDRKLPDELGERVRQRLIPPTPTTTLPRNVETTPGVSVGYHVKGEQKDDNQ